MNFFEQQERARGTTRKLVLLFVVAVATLVLITTVLVIAALGLSTQEQGGGLQLNNLPALEILLGVAVVVVGVVLLGTAYRSSQLRGGGRVVAETLGGRLLNLNTRDADERKMLNVVEEMAIAAGLPVPPVYLLEDPAINAFAAGYAQRDAVIGVTRGCIQKLSRDELQGVIAHEFSHIFNGDMRLNIRLIGWLYGIMVLGLIGYYLMRGSMFRHMGRSRNNRGNGLVFLGLGLVVVGYGGTFFGNLIKAAVSRQREFLADASAVQFTRNPAGISGALKKIGGFSEGSRITTADTSEVSHMLFGESVARSITGMFATHPPLEERIRRIEPGWDGEYPGQLPLGEEPATAGMGTGAGGGGGIDPGLSTLAGRIGVPGAQELALAREQLALVPTLLHDEVHSTLGSALVVQALFVASSPAKVAPAQQAWLRAQLIGDLDRQFVAVLGQVQALPRSGYLTLVELALPALAQLSSAQYRQFMSQLQYLMQMDAEITLFEWCLYRILKAHLDPSEPSAGANETLAQNQDTCRVLLSALARAGHAGDAEAATACAAGLAVLGQNADGSNTVGEQSAGASNVRGQGADASNAVPEREGVDASNRLLAGACGLRELDAAVLHLRRLDPPSRALLLEALVACVRRDGRVGIEEGELLRAVGAVLDCPIPPLGIT